MSRSKKILMMVCLLLICLTQSGCALFSLPGQLLGGLFNLTGQAFQLANSLPKPPPWMFF